MKILTVPHPSLRKESKLITVFDRKIQQVVKDVSKTLAEGPKHAVGLAAPQIDSHWRIYATRQSVIDPTLPQTLVSIFINPRITKTSKKHDFGEDADGTPLEGCLSIPGIYGPVPRFAWVEVEFERPAILGDKIDDSSDKNAVLVSDSVRLEGFPARLAQHEIDHLNGILFTDYTLQYDLPLYEENSRKKLIEIEDIRFVESY